MVTCNLSVEIHGKVHVLEGQVCDVGALLLSLVDRGEGPDMGQEEKESHLHHHSSLMSYVITTFQPGYQKGILSKHSIYYLGRQSVSVPSGLSINHGLGLLKLVVLF